MPQSRFHVDLPCLKDMQILKLNLVEMRLFIHIRGDSPIRWEDQRQSYTLRRPTEAALQRGNISEVCV